MSATTPGPWPWPPAMDALRAAPASHACCWTTTGPHSVENIDSRRYHAIRFELK
jgi:hypothetical protein